MNRRSLLLPSDLIELRAMGGTAVIIARWHISPRLRTDTWTTTALAQIFASRDLTAQLRSAWPRLNVTPRNASNLAPADMRRLLERATKQGPWVLMWLPRVSHGQLDALARHALAPAVPTPAIAPRPAPHIMVAASATRPPPSAVGTSAVSRPAQPAAPRRPNYATMSEIERVEEALLLALGRMPAQWLGDLASLDRKKLVHQMAIGLAVLGIIQFGGPLGAAVDLGLFAFGWFTVGFEIAAQGGKFIEATSEAMNARTPKEIDAAATKYVEVFEVLGAAIVSYLVGKGLKRLASKAGSKAEPEEQRPVAKTQSRPVTKVSTSLRVNVTEKGWRHVYERHMNSGLKDFDAKSKFQLDEQSLRDLIQSASDKAVTVQNNGNLARVWDTGRIIGYDMKSGAETSIVSVITKPDGTLVTAFPGHP